MSMYFTYVLIHYSTIVCILMCPWYSKKLTSQAIKHIHVTASNQTLSTAITLFNFLGQKLTWPLYFPKQPDTTESHHAASHLILQICCLRHLSDQTQAHWGLCQTPGPWIWIICNSSKMQQHPYALECFVFLHLHYLETRYFSSGPATAGCF